MTYEFLHSIFPNYIKTDIIQKEYDVWEREINTQKVIGELMSGEEFYEHVDCGAITDYGGVISDIWVDGYISNLGLCHNGLCQGKFLVDGDMWLDICREYYVTVEWCNR